MSKILKQVTTDGVEFFTKEDTGESGMSQSGLAILAGVTRQAIDQLIDTVSMSSCPEFLKPLSNRDLYLVSGVNEFQGADVLKSEVCALILEWYAFESQRTNDVAKDSFRKFAKKGIDTWIQEITGWSQQKTSVSNISQHTSVYIRRLENSRDHIIDYQYWGVFQEADWVYLMVEREWGVPVEQFDLLDGSIGKKWSNYRKDKTWTLPLGQYTHVFRDKRPPIICNAFDHKELSYFKEWLDKVYVPVHLPEYLVKKFGRKATRLIYTENGKLTNKILELTEIKRETQNMTQQFQDFLSKRQLLLGISKE
ncbi:hypothetical protein [Cyanobacterium aponinum]|uniref:hypothetical protein n=1 Tax=Cyanobacterium aponinum TaxID=379064 RepID=UPI000C12D9F5|nr:hypothetical protein [Cyanobacterium aponinum]PHV60996.1 hypothetical protein CSQ80_17950 [Cyanobacterium aponinum IPPAS B-1201]